MKWIILLLVLLNGGYYSWVYYNNSSNDLKESSVPDSRHELDTLVLLSEVSDDRKELLGIVKSDNVQAVESVPDASSPDDKSAGAVDGKDINVIEKSMSDDTASVSNEKINALTSDNKVKQDMLPAEEKAKETEKPLAISKYCYSIGPIKDNEKVTRLSKHIKSMGLTVVGVRKVIDKVPSHWIYLSGYKSEVAANNEISRLSVKGIKDTQIIKRNSDNYVISVGLFETKEGADERLKKLQSSGFSPQLTMVTANKSRYWLDVTYRDGEMIKQSILKGFLAGIQGAEIITSECGSKVQ